MGVTCSDELEGDSGTEGFVGVVGSVGVSGTGVVTCGLVAM